MTWQMSGWDIHQLKCFFHCDKSRYIGQDDSGDAREKINSMELVIKENKERKSKFLDQIAYITRKQENIRRCFYGLVTLLTGQDVTNKPLHSMLEICFKEVKKLIDKIGDGRVDLLMDQMEEDGYKIDSEDGDTFKVEEEQRRKKKEEAESAEAVEDEEVIYLINSVGFACDVGILISGSNKSFTKTPGRRYGER